MMFECDKCGNCCRNLKMSELYNDLDRGDGICRYLVGNLCSIYDNRPLKCNIDKSYDEFFSETMSREKFYEENYKICEKLKGRK